jgi:1,4-alpha-glucan branching enzyme
MIERSDAMPVTVHHKPVDSSSSYTLHAWIGTKSGDVPGTRRGDVFDFPLPDLGDLRRLLFKFYSTDARSKVEWESDDFIRRIRLTAPAEIWTFEQSARVLYKDPTPTGVAFKPGDTLTFHVITQNRFNGGRLYAWNPFAPGGVSATFDQSSRSDPVSTFAVPLQPWMTGGFHFKLIGKDGGGNPVWEPDSSNRVWSPGDGASLWLKSGQVSVRDRPLELKSMPVEVLYPAAVTPPPGLILDDSVDDFRQTFPPAATAPFPGGPPFRVATYTVPIYPEAAYQVCADGGSTAATWRPFPADPAELKSTSRFVLDAGGWLPAFLAAVTETLSIEPVSPSSFPGGLNVEAGVGGAVPHETVAAARRPDGTWEAQVVVIPTVENWIQLLPNGQKELRPYPAPYDDWIDIRRAFTPAAAPTTYYTREGVYGVAARGKTEVAEPDNRDAMMRAAFGDGAVGAGVFGPREMPHGATIAGAEVFFVVHAPHAAWAGLVLVDEKAPGGPGRVDIPMSLTADALYWWCKVPSSQAPPGTRYRFTLNDAQEVMDPAAREVLDRGDFETQPGEDPKDPSTSWSLVLDVEAVYSTSRVAPWQTLGWESLLVYEMHAKRFTDINPGTLSPLDIVADECGPACRRGVPGYLHGLPVTALELLPVHEFKSLASWGYNPAFFFAIDGFYGGSMALARMVNAAHANGKGVFLDLVYNHMNDSPLTQIAIDVYRNGDAWGDRVNHDHPMVKEFFRQAIVHTWRTFGLDGFRFDDTKTILNNNGWDFLSRVHRAVQGAASAEGRQWPYCVAENDQDGRQWNLSNPAWSVLDGQWAYDQSYRFRDVSYDAWNPSADDVGNLKNWMDQSPVGPGRQFFEATRYAESHDRVSEQDPGDRRVAARPPFGMGYQLAKAVGAVVLLSRGVPMLFMGEEVAETLPFSFDNNGMVLNPQVNDLPAGSETDRTRVLSWFRSLMGLRNDPTKGLRGNESVQGVKTGRRTVAFTCGSGQSLFVVATFGTPDQRQDSSWLGLPDGSPYKEIFNSSWPAFAVESEPEHTNGSYAARISSGQILNLPYVGAVVLERC